MSIPFHCSSCQTRIQAPAESAGAKAMCPHCKAIVVVPGARSSLSYEERPEFPPPPAREFDHSPDDLDAPRRRSRRYDDEEDDYDERPSRRRRRWDEDDDDYEESPRRSRFRCPYCRSDEPPIYRNQISPAGWIVFSVFIFFCLPLFWVGLLITEDYRQCRDCGRRLG